MVEKDAFGNCHPVNNFLYYAILLGFTMFSMQPVCLIISVVFSIIYLVMLKGAKAGTLLLRGVLPLFFLTVLINPAFSHQGMTILYYLPTGNPLTLESIIYGVAAGLMIVGILIWFACFSHVVTSDKFVYLFGKIIPVLSMLLSMTLRFVPMFVDRFRTVSEVQKTLGYDTATGSLNTRIKNAIKCFSIVITWSLENSIETSDSMKSRGYGMKKRTSYSIYRWDDRDGIILGFLAFCALFLLAGGLSGNLYWRYFPSIRGVLFEPITIALEITYLLLCAMPVFLNWREKVKWNYLESKI